MRKLYCYVDESGQETQGRIFIVTVVVLTENNQQLIDVCESYEKISRKGRRKWHGSSPKSRLAFMKLVLNDTRFVGVLCFSKLQSRAKPNYEAFTVDTLADVITSRLGPEQAVIEVWIDGLSQTKRTEYANVLRAKGLRNISLHRVRKEESNTLIRLADTLAGFLRDSIEGNYTEVVQLEQQGRKSGIIVEI